MPKPAPLRVAFMGTPDFAVPSLSALVAAGHDVVAVYTQPPRPAGRGHRPRPSPVQAFAAANGIAVRTPARLKDPADQAALAALNLDVAVVAAYGLILPPPVLAAPRLGCVNVHASLLPRWRGAAPIQRAILAGDAETGISIMAMDAGLDTGPVLMSEAMPIGDTTTAGDLHDALAALGGRLIGPALEGLAAGRLVPAPQPDVGVTYAAKIAPEDGRIDWRDAVYADRQVRAFNPWPGAWFAFGEERIKILSAEPADGLGPAGLVLDDRLTVACTAGGALRPTRLQRPGRAAMATADFLRGFPMPAGTVLSGAA